MNLRHPLIVLLALLANSAAGKDYKPPYPHSTGAQLLPHCQQTDAPVDLLRCDYYLQGVADLAITRFKGDRLACIPRGTNRTELIEMAVEHLASQKPDVLEKYSAATLMLQVLQKNFRCPAKKAAAVNKKTSGPSAMQKAIGQAIQKEQKKKEQQEKQQQDKEPREEEPQDEPAGEASEAGNN